MLSAPLTLTKGLYYVGALKARGVPLLDSVSKPEIKGEGSVSGIHFLDNRGMPREIPCDAVAMGFHLQAETQLADLAGCTFRYAAVSRQWIPDVDDDGRAGNGVYLAGDGMMIRGADAAEATGALAALSVLSDWDLISPDDSRFASLRRKRRRLIRFQEGVTLSFPFPQRVLRQAEDDLILCRCEAITFGEYRRSSTIGLGADDVNRLKAFSRVGMGRCQGRFCGLSAMDALAAQRNISP
jgi:hypothetical protein